MFIFSVIITFTFICSCSQRENAHSESAQTSSIDMLETSLLLNNFRPQSIYRIPRTSVEKARYPIIDMHTHAYAKSPQDLEQWIQTMDARGIQKSIILTAATGAEFDSLVDVYGKYPDRFELWCGFDYTGYNEPGFGPAAVAELERCVRVGARGVGELGDKGKGLYYSKPAKAWGMHLDDPRMDVLLKKCGELDLPVNVHIAEPIWMYESMDSTNDGLMNANRWRLDNQPDIVGHSEMIDILERAVKHHPNTIFIACHYANLSYDLSRLGDLFDQYPNLYADISARFMEIGPIPRFVSRFYTKYQDRLLYGTDWGTSSRMYALTFRILETHDEHFYGFEYDFNNHHYPIHGLGLEDRILRKVYRSNALRILN
ncbi:amidohydrolase family protein [candidate division KSB1 bacterium]|nr:amidohydrolase family protein [candidate division KSB1 bacterium]